MVDVGFFGFLLTLLVLHVMFQGPAKAPEQLTSSSPGNEYAEPQYETSEKFNNFVPEYGYGDPEYESPEKLTNFVTMYEGAHRQYGSDNNFGLVPSPSLLDDKAQLPAQIENKPSDYDKIYEPEEDIQLDSTGAATTEMANHHHVSEHIIDTTEQLEFDATPTVKVDTNETVTNDTTVKQTKDIPLPTAITILRFVSVTLTIISTALFITIMFLMWNNDVKFSSIKCKIVYKSRSENTDGVKAKYRATLKI